eukprot:SM000353S13162  [mRNA]  locus=s353:31753:34866:+ [translate_table: standard]
MAGGGAGGGLVARPWEAAKAVLLPEGFPESVTEDYPRYTRWRMAQIVASEMNGVLTTQAMLYAVGLGKGAIPTAAAVQWVLKDGIGYLSKIFLSKFGRHFDVHPKGWRLVADAIENAAYGLELATAAAPHLFVYLGAAAGASRSAAGLIQSATRSCFYAGFAAQRNYADIIAKGEAQGMASKSLGIALGIAISGRVGARGPALAAAYAAISSFHLYCNLRSYQAIQLRTLNPYRAALVLAEVYTSGRVPSVKEVNAEEPFLPTMPWLPLRSDARLKDDEKVLSAGSKQAARDVQHWMEFGASLASVVSSRAEAEALLALYRDENFILASKNGRMKVILREAASSRDLMRAMVQAIYLQRLQKHVGLGDGGDLVQDCQEGGQLRQSLAHLRGSFEATMAALGRHRWITPGLVARPGPSRLLQAAA